MRIEDRRNTENSEMDEGSLIDIIVQVIPMAWKDELVRENYDPSQNSVDDV